MTAARQNCFSSEQWHHASADVQFDRFPDSTTSADTAKEQELSNLFRILVANMPCILTGDLGGLLPNLAEICAQLMRPFKEDASDLQAVKIKVVGAKQQQQCQ